MERGMTADQVLSALWRRKALVGAIALAVFAAGAGFVMLQPSVYTATTVVRVDPQRPQPEMVSHTVSELIEDRLLTVRQELLGRPVLERAIQEFNLYPEVVSQKGMDAAVERMRKDIDVKVDGQNAFEVSYSSHDPAEAQKVANRLPELFSEETSKIRQEQAARATQLFDDELGQLKTQLSSWEKKIAQFKVDHLGELPEQLEMNMRSLERIGGQLNTKSEELRVAEGRRSELALAHHAADTEVGRLEATEDGLATQLIDAQSHWTADHPEVQRLQTTLEATKQKRMDAERSLFAERREKARVNQLIANIQKDIDGLHQQADAFQKRLDETPKWAQELAGMNSEYEIVKAKYASVISRRVEAEMAQDLEAKSAKSLFNVISAAGMPVAPAKPDRMTGMLVALLAALGIGVLTGVILEMRDDSVRDHHEIKGRLPIPVLAVVPNMQGKTERRVLMPANVRNNVPPSTTLN